MALPPVSLVLQEHRRCGKYTVEPGLWSMKLSSLTIMAQCCTEQQRMSPQHAWQEVPGSCTWRRTANQAMMMKRLLHARDSGLSLRAAASGHKLQTRIAMTP